MYLMEHFYLLKVIQNKKTPCEVHTERSGGLQLLPGIKS